MKKYRVTIPFACFVSVTVEADSKEEAEENGYREASITSYCGNGGSDKLIGVYGDESIEPGSPMEGEECFHAHVEELEDE